MKAVLLVIGFLLFAPSVPHAQTVDVGCVNQATSSDPVHCDTFNIPDGTALNGKTTDDGAAQWVANGAVVINGEYTNAAGGWPYANPYANFQNTSALGGLAQPLTHMEGTFRYHTDSIGCAVAIIATTSAAAFMSKMLHVVVCNNRAEVAVAAPGYVFPTLLGVINYTKLTKDALYGVSMDFDVPNNKWTVSVAGKTKTFTHPAVGLVAPDTAVYQVGAGNPSGTAGWVSVATGSRSKANAFVASGDAAPIQVVDSILERFNKVTVQKTGAALGYDQLIGKFVTSGAQAVNTVRVRTVATNGTMSASQSSGTAVNVDEWEMTLNSDGAHNLVANVKPINHTDVQSQGVCLATALHYSISGNVGEPHTLLLYANTNITGGCANNSKVTSARINSAVEVEGDPYGTLTAQ